jgi:hypothetical protein
MGVLARGLSQQRPASLCVCPARWKWEGRPDARAGSRRKPLSVGEITQGPSRAHFLSVQPAAGLKAGAGDGERRRANPRQNGFQLFEHGGQTSGSGWQTGTRRITNASARYLNRHRSRQRFHAPGSRGGSRVVRCGCEVSPLASSPFTRSRRTVTVPGIGIPHRVLPTLASPFTAEDSEKNTKRKLFPNTNTLCFSSESSVGLKCIHERRRSRLLGT